MLQDIGCFKKHVSVQRRLNDPRAPAIPDRSYDFTTRLVRERARGLGGGAEVTTRTRSLLLLFVAGWR